MDTKFLLLLGVSGVGKSTVIRELRSLDPRFEYVSPYTTRQLRDGETDKIHVSDEVMDRMESTGEFVVVNNLYGVRYGTPREPIVTSLQRGSFPILDWPIQKLKIMQELFPLYVVYITPPSIEKLTRRLNIDGRDNNGSRLSNALAELKRFQKGEFEGMCDISVVSEDETIPQISQGIYDNFLRSLI